MKLLKVRKWFKNGLKAQKLLGGCVKTPNINKKNSLYVLVWMYNEFLFFYKNYAKNCRIA